MRVPRSIINFLARIINPGARQRPISPAWDRKQQISTFGSSPSLVERIDAWRARQRVPPSRTAAIVDWNKGQRVLVTGTIKTTLMGDVQLDDCKLVKK
jgi:hypothetical protein